MLLSPAKLNLGLRIVGRRADGYHLLESLFWPIDLCDKLSLNPSVTPKTTATWDDTVPPEFRSELPPSSENLITRALAAAGRSFEVILRKRVPIGGGLGGGSSNAGTILAYLREREGLSERAACDLALSLGADVPYFLNPSPAWVTGIGENIAPLRYEGRPLYFLLMLLPNPTPTPQVFAELRKRPDFSKSLSLDVSGVWTDEKLETYLAQCTNDLEVPAGIVNPLIPRALEAMRRLPCQLAALSGSGSTCFALFHDEASRQETDKALRHFCRQYQCRTLSVGTFVRD